eukprot:GHVO01043333.1.p1 GENE.GHVO01043333.1~~GHVO01043333.1.p1  ORF type:complete len:155 (+),score=18.71 GHVO01043333.1:109-573(+)
MSAQAALRGNEPSDSVRVVNALLTQLDSLKSMPNCLILATSNITGAIDDAFLDRADMKVHIPEPGLSCRFEIFRGAIEELLRRQVLHCKSNRPICSFAEVSSAIQDGPSTNSEKLLAVSKLCDGLSGRALRKIPFQAFSSFNTVGCFLSKATHA